MIEPRLTKQGWASCRYADMLTEVGVEGDCVNETSSVPPHRVLLKPQTVPTLPKFVLQSDGTPPPLQLSTRPQKAFAPNLLPVLPHLGYGVLAEPNHV
jgi:hypothetical protein